MKTNSVKCDSCGEEQVVETNYPHHWGLQLSTVDFKQNRGGMIFDVMLYPPLEREYHFCGLHCLRAWVVKNVQAPASERRDSLDGSHG